MTPSATIRGRRVAARRAQLGYTQEALARRLGCTLRTLQRIERGASPTMSQRLIEALQEHLDLPIGTLLHVKRSTRGA
jgi:transcriptional regulator with XRE-family HTH domain